MDTYCRYSPAWYTDSEYAGMCLYFSFFSFFYLFLDRRWPGPTKSVLLVIIGWLVGWLVGNASFSETIKVVGDYKSRKVTQPDF